MKNRHAFLLTLASGVVALTVVVGTALADELVGAISAVDVEGKKLTVIEKGTYQEIRVAVTDDTEYVSPKGVRKLDLEKLARHVEKSKEKNGRGMYVHITHENAVASRIEFAKQGSSAQGRR